MLFRGTVNNRQLNFTVERAVSEAHKHLREPWFASALAKCGGFAPTSASQALLAAAHSATQLCAAPIWPGQQPLSPAVPAMAFPEAAAASLHAGQDTASAMVSEGRHYGAHYCCGQPAAPYRRARRSNTTH